MREHGSDITAYLQAASTAIAARNWAAAEQALTACVAIAPDDPSVSYNLALVEKRLGKLDAAADRLAHLLGLAPDHKNARFELAAALMDLGAEGQALAEFETYLRSNPEDADARLNAARLCLRLGRAGESGDHLTIAEQSRSGDAAIALARAETARDTGDVDRAVAIYRRLYVEAPELRPAILKSMCQGANGRLPLSGII